MHVHLELSSVCTLKCSQCLRALYKNELSGILDKFIDYKKICRFVKENITDIQYIYICGNLGENIIHPKFLVIMRYITYLINKHGLTTRIIIKTNGEMYDLKFWKRLKTISDKIDYFHVKIAIDTLGDDQYNYRNNNVLHILDTVRYYINLGGKVIWSSVLLDNNKDLIKRMIYEAKTMGCVGYELKIGWDNANAKDDEYKSLDLEDINNKEFYCENIDNTFVNINFLVTPCVNITKLYLIGYSKLQRNLPLSSDECMVYNAIDKYKEELTYSKENPLQVIMKSSGYSKILQILPKLEACTHCFNGSSFMLYF